MGDTTDPSKGTTDPLYVSTRAQMNFAENVPFVMVLALLAELNGANRYYMPLHAHTSYFIVSTQSIT
jgi:uncharacterized membrane protein YecN with MAPEG domain